MGYSQTRLPAVKEVHHTQWSVQVDVIDAPDLVLVLPARKEIYRNAALTGSRHSAARRSFRSSARNRSTA